MLFGSASRGVPSFGDLSWKRPVVAASDPSQSWSFPVPVLSPTGAPSFKQTLTAGANQAITSAPPFSGMTIVAGDRILVTGDGGVANSAGIWVVTTVGSGASKWVLTRATDADSAVELPVGAITIAKAFLLSGTIHTNYGMFSRVASSAWELRPNLLDIVEIVTSLTVGDGSVDPPLSVSGSVSSDGLLMDDANRDVRLYRSAAKTLTIDDNGGAELTRIAALADRVDSATGTSTSFTISGGGTATFGSKSCTWYRLGKFVIFFLNFSVTANGSGATQVSIAQPVSNLPQSATSPINFLGDRGGVGVQPIIARMSNDGTRLSLDNIKVITTTGISAAITGADLANGAAYHFVGAYIAN